MQAHAKRLLSTFFIAIVGAAASLIGADAQPAEQPASLSCGLLAQVALAPR